MYWRLKQFAWKLYFVLLISVRLMVLMLISAILLTTNTPTQEIYMLYMNSDSHAVIFRETLTQAVLLDLPGLLWF